MTQYEYYTLTNATYLGARLLDTLGKEGWELITHVYDSNCQLSNRHVYTFKRVKVNVDNMS